MNKANRPRKQARPDPFKDAKKRILVVCEGSTEKEYVDSYVASLKNQLVVSVKAHGNSGVPITVVERARDLQRENAEDARRENDANVSFDSVWVMFDVDDHPRVGEAKQMALDNGIAFAVSNPCIELWLYLHFADPPGMQDRHKLLRMLKKHILDYDKHIRFAFFRDGIEPARKRAADLDHQAESDGEPGRNPTTGVWKLLNDIGEDEEKDQPGMLSLVSY